MRWKNNHEVEHFCGTVMVDVANHIPVCRQTVGRYVCILSCSKILYVVCMEPKTALLSVCPSTFSHLPTFDYRNGRNIAANEVHESPHRIRDAWTMERKGGGIVIQIISGSACLAVACMHQRAGNP